MDGIDLLQWPAMLATLLAAWWIGSQRAHRRCIGFICFITSNLLWGIWGWHTQAWALIVLQVCLFLMNLRGLRKNAPAATRPEESPS
ncbi:hypothetical protein V0R50_15520 [Pseudomonas sp. 148P]|uniref:Amino acid transporter n=1 Tax=Pseudomonas ulcerans TaxID=3115852 RepID=A0ABU7HSY5_9PSED|nr:MULTISPECIES: hypothetical protein [unclassified Pseudomonas]MEE1920694.1 hypothetical protein [Pseudomonas sp. 147P]MEE1934637.1 hypothetical protein [Pseudomonas sp. 148P]